MYSRHPSVKLRREHFGGIAFHRMTGTLIELDKQACILLENADGKTSLQSLAEKIGNDLGTEISIHDVYNTVEELLAHGFLIKNGQSFPIKATEWPEESEYLSAPETVHLAVTHRCNFGCKSCYVEPVSQEMTTGEIKSLIDEMAEMKVFQLAIGGGEPFLRDDLIDIVRYAAEKGIVPNITTNGSFITPEIAAKLSGYVGQVQISLNHFKNNGKSRDEKSYESALRAIRILLRYDINYGINTLITKDNFPDINNIIKFAVDHMAGTINFIRPKPSKDSNWYKNAKLAKEDFIEIRETLKNAQYPIRITVDCAFSFLMKDETPEALAEHGVYGCTVVQIGS